LKGMGPVNLSVTTLRAMAVYLQWVSDPPGSESAVAAPHPCPPSASFARLAPAKGGERETGGGGLESANGPTRFSGWGRLSLAFPEDFDCLAAGQAETREGSSTIEKRTP